MPHSNVESEMNARRDANEQKKRKDVCALCDDKIEASPAELIQTNLANDKNVFVTWTLSMWQIITFCHTFFVRLSLLLAARCFLQMRPNISSRLTTNANTEKTTYNKIVKMSEMDITNVRVCVS